MAYRFQLRVSGATDKLATSLRHLPVIAAVLAMTSPGAANDRLLEPPRPMALPDRFASTMTRARLNWFIHGPRPLSVAFDHARSSPTIIPFFWEAEDGSTIRRMPDSSFRMEIWTAAANWTTYVFCEPAGWPVYTCTDGAIHQMSAPDLLTVIFAGRTFTRTLPSSDPSAGAPELSQE